MRAPRCARLLAYAVLAPGIGATPAFAQQASPPPPTTPPTAFTTLDRVQALRPDEEVLDLYTFKNPVTVEPNTFDKVYNPGISPELMGKDPRDGGYGGYVYYGINQGLLHTWKCIKQVTGMRPYEHPATARPPPLSLEQMDRAARTCGDERQGCTDNAAAGVE
ncbi:hypothetical protein [Pseudoxanthomonas sp. UC19_8]|uniref:hypothetical protein n=1 Tax=Pseudoxanthomonas sp. UC19_8 TaxID=3350175 RepID=UPI0036D33D86